MKKNTVKTAKTTPKTKKTTVKTPTKKTKAPVVKSPKSSTKTTKTKPLGKKIIDAMEWNDSLLYDDALHITPTTTKKKATKTFKNVELLTLEINFADADIKTNAELADMLHHIADIIQDYPTLKSGDSFHSADGVQWWVE